MAALALHYAIHGFPSSSSDQPPVFPLSLLDPLPPSGSATSPTSYSPRPQPRSLDPLIGLDRPLDFTQPPPSAAELRWELVRSTSRRIKKYTRLKLLVELLIGVWSGYCVIRYFIASSVYSDDHLRAKYVLALGSLNTFTLLSLLSQCLPFSFSQKATTRKIISYTSSLTFLAPPLINLILTKTWKSSPSFPSRAVIGRCQFSLDIIYTGTGSICLPGVSYRAFLAGGILRFLGTVLVVGVWWRSLRGLERSMRAASRIPPERRRSQGQLLSPTSPTHNRATPHSSPVNGPLRTRPIHTSQPSQSSSTSLAPLINLPPPNLDPSPGPRKSSHSSGEESNISDILRRDSGATSTSTSESSTLVSARPSTSRIRDTSFLSLSALDIPVRPSLDYTGPSNEIDKDIVDMSNLENFPNLETIERDIYRSRVETFNAILEHVTGHNVNWTDRDASSSSSSSSSSTRASSSRASSRSSTAYSYTSRPPSRSSMSSMQGIKISRPLSPDPSSAPSLLAPPDFSSTDSGTRTVQVVGRLVRRMSTIESFGSREGEGASSNSSPISSAKSTQSGTRRVAMVDTVPVLGADTDTDIDVVDVDEALQPDTQDSYGVGVGVGRDASANLDCGEPRYAAIAAIAGAVEAEGAVAPTSSSVTPALFDHHSTQHAPSPARPPLRPSAQPIVRSTSLPDLPLTPRLGSRSSSPNPGLPSPTNPRQGRLTGISHRSTRSRSLPELSALRTLSQAQTLDLRNVINIPIVDREDLEASESEDLSQAQAASEEDIADAVFEDEDSGLGESGDSTDDYGMLIDTAQAQEREQEREESLPRRD